MDSGSCGFTWVNLNPAVRSGKTEAAPEVGETLQEDGGFVVDSHDFSLLRGYRAILSRL